MNLHRRPHTSKLAATVVCISLILPQCGLAFTEQDNARHARLETCRKLLESITNPSSWANVSAALSQDKGTTTVIDLSSANSRAFATEVAKAKVTDIVVMNEQRLGDRKFISALEKSPAVFSVATPLDGSQHVGNILNSQAEQPEIVVAIPTNASGVEKVFAVPQQISAPTVNYLVEVSEKFRGLKNSYLLNHSIDGRSLANQLISKAKRATSNPLIVVAHNEKGVLKLPDGSTIGVDTLYQALGGRRGVVLSCDTVHSQVIPSNALLTNRQLDFKDIAAGLASAERSLSKDPKLSLASFLFAFSQAIPRVDPSVAETVKVVAMVVGGLIVVALIYYWVCEDSSAPPPFCPARTRGASIN